MGAQQVVPAIFIDERRGLTVDGDILLNVPLHAEARLGVEFDEAYSAEVSTVTGPEASRRGVKQQAGVYGVLILHAVAGTYLDGL